MNQPLQQLLTLLQPQPLDQHRFLGQSEDIGLPRVFGGQVMGQALYVAQQTVDPARQIHSLHCYFMLPAEHETPILYQATCLRDGQSFSTRQVDAYQQHRHLFTLTASFQRREQGFDHQQPMPAAPPPTQIPGETELYRRMGNSLSASQREKRLKPQPMDIRPVSFFNPFTAWPPASDTRQIWLRANGQVPDDPILQHSLLAWASDRHFLPTALQPHGLGYLQPGMQVATISHALWFQRKVNFNDWLLYHIQTPSAISGRGLVRGEFYNQQGQLIATSAQEGLIRRRAT